MNCPRCTTPKPDLGMCTHCRHVSSASGTLVGADLRDLDLSGCDLRSTDLSGADLGGARLDGGHLTGAILYEVQVEGASLHRTKIDLVFAGVLSGYSGTPDWVQLGISLPPIKPSTLEALPRYEVAGNPLHCPLCRTETFAVRTINTSGRALAFLDLEWLGTASVALTCTSCFHMLWFAQEPLRRT